MDSWGPCAIPLSLNFALSRLVGRKSGRARGVHRVADSAWSPPWVSSPLQIERRL